MKGVGTELILVDKDPALAAAQAGDILHATPFAKSMPVKSGSFESLKGCGIVMICAGASQKPGENRLDLLKRNADIFSELIPKILHAAPDAILLVASNPVDIMTHMASHFALQAGQAPGRVIGSGTILDTARFRTLLAQHLGVSSHSVHAHVLGEHGDSEVLHWSGANVSNLPLTTFAEQIQKPVTQEVIDQIDDGVRRAAYHIIAGKGATWYGIGGAMARIAKAIESDEHSIITCCSPLEQVQSIKNVTLSVPRIISAEGVGKIIWPVLIENEQKLLDKSAGILKQALDSIGF
jgi:L-lactate dehydrogenase